MVTRADICKIVQSYVEHLGRHEVEQLMALFADDAVLFEPLGVLTHRGRDEIEAFARECAEVDFTARLLSPITVVGRFAATQLLVTRAGMAPFAASDLYEFNDDGLIVTLRVLPDPEARVDGSA